MRYLSTLILMMAVSVFMYSCSSGSFKKTKSGMLYQIVKNGNGEKLKPGTYVKFHVKTFQKDSLSYNSYGKLPAFMGVDSIGRPYDLTEVMPLLSVGDSVIVIQLIDSIAKFMGGQIPPGFKKGDKIKYHISILETYKNMPEAQAAFDKEMDNQKRKESAEIEKYLKDKNINAAKTQLGTYVEIINAGQGPKPDSGKQVSVKYTGSKFNGKKFDSNVDTTFGHTAPLDVLIGQMNVVPGFEDGIKQLAKGGKARVFIPSMLAYGMSGSAPAIEPLENLIFEIEVLDIKQAPKPEPAPPMPDKVDVPVTDTTKSAKGDNKSPDKKK